ncbi:MAG: hypothetical protein MJ064_09140 [Lachnospiraceae bacterium]|nr:hypothetical protein [Lachnospiraceae bacterium]
MKKRRGVALLLMVLLIVLCMGNAFAATNRIGLVVFNDNRTLAIGGNCIQNGKNSNMNAYIAGRDMDMVTDTDARNMNIKYIYEVYSNSGILYSSNGYVWKNHSASESYSNSNASKTRLALSIDTNTNYIESYR